MVWKVESEVSALTIGKRPPALPGERRVKTPGESLQGV